MDQKVTISSLTKLISKIKSGAHTYDLLELSPELSKAAADVMDLYPSKSIGQAQKFNVSGSQFTVQTENAAQQMSDTRSIFKRSDLPPMDVRLEKANFFITGRDVTLLKDPIVLVGVSGGGNGCTDPRHFLMSMPTMGSPTATPDFGQCDD